MLQRDFDEFTRQASVLFAGFNVPATQERIEAYWRGLQRMDLLVFTRVVEYALGGNGVEKLPTAPQLWSLQKSMRARPAAAPIGESAPAFDSLHCFGQRCLLRWLRENGPVEDAALVQLVSEKNRLIEQFHVIATEEQLTADDVRPAMMRAFDRTLQALAA